MNAPQVLFFEKMTRSRIVIGWSPRDEERSNAPEFSRTSGARPSLLRACSSQSQESVALSRQAGPVDHPSAVADQTHRSNEQ